MNVNLDALQRTDPMIDENGGEHRSAAESTGQVSHMDLFDFNTIAASFRDGQQLGDSWVDFQQETIFHDLYTDPLPAVLSYQEKYD